MRICTRACRATGTRMYERQVILLQMVMREVSGGEENEKGNGDRDKKRDVQ